MLSHAIMQSPEQPETPCKDSKALASLSTVVSSNRLPMNIIPTGRPSTSPAGTEIAGGQHVSGDGWELSLCIIVKMEAEMGCRRFDVRRRRSRNCHADLRWLSSPRVP